MERLDYETPGCHDVQRAAAAKRFWIVRLCNRIAIGALLVGCLAFLRTAPKPDGEDFGGFVFIFVCVPIIIVQVLILMPIVLVATLRDWKALNRGERIRAIVLVPTSALLTLGLIKFRLSF